MRTRLAEQRRRADLTAQHASAQEEASPTAQPTPGDNGGLMLGSIISFAAAGAGLALTAIFGSLALVEHDNLASGCGATTSCTPADIEASDTYALIADVGLGVGSAAAVVGIVLLAIGLSSGGSQPAETATLTPTGWLSDTSIGFGGRLSW